MQHVIITKCDRFCCTWPLSVHYVDAVLYVNSLLVVGGGGISLTWTLQFVFFFFFDGRQLSSALPSACWESPLLAAIMCSVFLCWPWAWASMPLLSQDIWSPTSTCRPTLQVSFRNRIVWSFSWQFSRHLNLTKVAFLAAKFCMVLLLLCSNWLIVHIP